MSEQATVEPPVATTPRRKRGTALTSSQTRTAWLLLLPTLLIVAFIALYPLAQTIYYSFTNYAGYGEWSFIGLSNYINLFRDERILNAYGFTFLFARILSHNPRVCSLPMPVSTTVQPSSSS